LGLARLTKVIHKGMGSLEDFEHTTSVGRRSEFRPDGLYWKGATRPTDEFLEFQSGIGEMALCRIGSACLRKIARVSGSPKSSEPAEEKTAYLKPGIGSQNAQNIARHPLQIFATICLGFFYHITCQTEAKNYNSLRIDGKHIRNQSI
jgi:hypothetical protein